MVRFIGHELRTPLNTVVLGMNYLEQIHLSDEYSETVIDCKKSCDDAIQILNQLILYNDLSSDSLSLHKTNIPTNFIHDIIQSYTHQVIYIY
jgi:signal transduction histidine kinase